MADSIKAGFDIPFQDPAWTMGTTQDRVTFGMVQKRPFSGNTRDLRADPDRCRVGAGLRESLVAVLGPQFRENRVYPRSSSQ